MNPLFTRLAALADVSDKKGAGGRFALAAVQLRVHGDNTFIAWRGGLDTGHRLKTLFVFAVASGMRQGELFALRWQDIDLKTGEVHVRHSLEELNGKLRLKEPKTKAGKRTVILPPLAKEALLDHRKRMFAEGHYGQDCPVFPDADGGRLRKSNFIRRVYAPILKKAGLVGIRFHDWRHYHASQMIALGAKVVQ